MKISRLLATLVGGIYLTLCAASCTAPTAQDTYQRGVTLRDANRIAEAQTAFEGAIQRFPKYAPPYRALAEMAHAAQDYRSAAGLWSAYLELDPEAAHGWCNLAQSELMQRLDKSAMGHAQKELTLSPDCTNAHLAMGILYSRQGNHRQALGHLEKAAKAYPQDSRIQLTYGRTLAQAGKYAPAETVLTRLSQTAGNQPEPHYWLGYVYAHRSISPADAKKAEISLRRAIEIGKSQTPANYELGRLLIRLKRYSEAILPLQRAAIADLNDPAPLAALAQAHTAQNQKADAADAQEEFKRRRAIEERRNVLLRAYDADPNDINTGVELAQMELERGEVNRAMLLLENARAIAPDDARIQKLYEEAKNRLFLLSTLVRKP